MTFKAPWLPQSEGEAVTPVDDAPRCRFITSFGGAARCQDFAYLLGFCEFHFDAFERGEIDEEGRISDKLDDQERRRRINFHGLELPDEVKPLL
jgi:hypothetical protein